MAAIAAAAMASAVSSYAANTTAIRTSNAQSQLPELEPATVNKCESCGSRQFKQHESKRVCTYCRSEQ